jgi:hypothetical protein
MVYFMYELNLYQIFQLNAGREGYKEREISTGILIGIHLSGSLPYNLPAYLPTCL